MEMGFESAQELGKLLDADEFYLDENGVPCCFRCSERIEYPYDKIHDCIECAECGEVEVCICGEFCEVCMKSQKWCECYCQHCALPTKDCDCLRCEECGDNLNDCWCEPYVDVAIDSVCSMCLLPEIDCIC